MKHCMVLLLLLFPVCGIHAWDFCQENADGIMLYYNYIDENSCEIAYCREAVENDGYAVYTLRIPETVRLKSSREGYEDEDTVMAVIGIADNAFEGGNFWKIELPETIGYIGERAFKYSRLSAIEFPVWCYHIGSNAFDNCSNLKYVKIPGTIEELGIGAFRMSGIEKVEFAPNKYIKEIPIHLFMRCEYLGEFVVPSFIKIIGLRAFQGSGLSKIKIPEGVEVIGDAAFYDVAFNTLELPASIKEIGERAMQSVKYLYVNRYVPPYCKSITSLGTEKQYDYDTRTFSYANKPCGEKTRYLIIPIGTNDVYQTTYPWTRYDERCYKTRNISGIPAVTAGQAGSEEESIFSLDGRQLEFKQKGINIVRYKDGTSRKVLKR